MRHHLSLAEHSSVDASSQWVLLTGENKVQEWLSRSHFGLGADKYADATLQEAHYNLATE
jgi:hypothetical protein